MDTEKLADFYFKCGMLDHVTGRCRFSEPATISSKNGITTKLYGLWIKAENTESILFINPEEENGERGNGSRSSEQILIPSMAQISRPSNLNDRLEESLTGAAKLVRNP